MSFFFVTKKLARWGHLYDFQKYQLGSGAQTRYLNQSKIKKLVVYLQSKSATYTKCHTTNTHFLKKKKL